MKKRRPKKISVLLIPDDNAEPYSFRLNIRIVRALVLLAIVLFVHVIAGGYAYWRWFETHQDNKQLMANNDELLEDNKRVYILQEKFEELSKVYDRVLGLLGVPGGKAFTLPFKDDELAASGRIPRPDLRGSIPNNVQPDLEKLTAKCGFLYRKTASLHDYTPSLPTLLPVEGYLSADFSHQNWLLGEGQPGLGKRHLGIDVAGPRGTEILAAGSGVVVFAGWTSKYGNILILHHGDGLFSYYAHNSKLLVSDRSYVRKGDPIAQRGDSGSTAKGPHLHFEIWKNGRPVNPREYVLAFHSEGS